MAANDKYIIEMLDEIDRARSGTIPLDELEQKLWRLLDSVDQTFPNVVASRVEDMVLELRRLRAENLSYGNHRDTDEFKGAEEIFNSVAGALQRILG